MPGGGADLGADNGDFGLARYLSDGTLDDTFGVGGKVRTDFSGEGSQEFISAIALASDGKIVAVGQSNANGPWPGIAVARYYEDGSIDDTFGDGGKVLVRPIPTAGIRGASGVAIQEDGKIVVSGFARAGTNGEFVVLRLQDDGTLDGTFGTDGIVITDISNRSDDKSFGMALQSDGKIVVAGHSRFGGITIVRYLGDALSIEEQLLGLSSSFKEIVSNKGIRNSLVRKVDVALSGVRNDRPNRSCGSLRALENELAGLLRAGALTTPKGEELVQEIRGIEEELECRLS